MILQWTVRGALLAVIAIAALVASALPASAIVVHLAGDKALSYQPLRGATSRLSVKPFDAFFTNLDYNGGPVMPSNTNYTVYWSPSGPSAYPAGYQTGVNGYLEDLAHDSGGTANVDSVSSQYNDTSGKFAEYDSHFGGALLDTHPYPKNGCTQATICLTDAQIQTELTRFVEAEHLPMDLTHEYFLLTPPKVESCFEASGEECSAGSSKPVYCAYHGNIPVAGGELIYANDPYVTGNGGCDDGNHPNGPSDGALEGGLSHEHNESITDPEPNNAWTDFGGPEPGEIGDKCGGETGAPLGETGSHATYNQVINGHFYWYQEEWSNQSHGCLQRLSFSGERPVATFRVIAESPTNLRFDATGSTAPGGVKHYNWQFNEERGGPGVPVETTGPALSNVLPAGSHTVALTVFAADGSSIGTARTITVGGKGPTAAFSVGASPTAGEAVSFDGSSSTDPGGKVTSYAWEFGDGSTQTGASPSHVFAYAGTYEVKLTVLGSDGLSASKTQSVVVAAPAGGGGETGGSGGGTSGGTSTTTGESVVVLKAGLPPPVALTASVALGVSSVPVQGNGQAGFRLTCSGNAPICAGQIKVTIRLTSGRHRHRRMRMRSVTIATGAFAVQSGRSTAVSIRLNTNGLARLRAAKGNLSATATIFKSSPAPALTQSRTIRLALQKRGSKGHP